MSDQSADKHNDQERSHPQEPAEGDVDAQGGTQREHTEEPAEGGDDGDGK